MHSKCFELHSKASNDILSLILHSKNIQSIQPDVLLCENASPCLCDLIMSCPRRACNSQLVHSVPATSAVKPASLSSSSLPLPPLRRVRPARFFEVGEERHHILLGRLVRALHALVAAALSPQRRAQVPHTHLISLIHPTLNNC